jgi:hypothetical protein
MHAAFQRQSSGQHVARCFKRQIVEQGLAVEHERLALLEVAECLEKRHIIAFAGKHALVVVAAIDHVVDQIIVDGA